MPESLVVGGPISVTTDAFDGLVVAGRVTNAETDAAVTELAPKSTVAFRNVTEAPHSMSRTIRWWTTWTLLARSGAPNRHGIRR